MRLLSRASSTLMASSFSLLSFPCLSSLKMTIKPMANLSNSKTTTIPYELKKGQTRLFHKLPSGLKMEVIEQRKDKADREKNPPLVFVHGSYHAAWCWAEHWLPFFSSSGFDSYALSLLGQVNSQVIKVLIFMLKLLCRNIKFQTLD